MRAYSRNVKRYKSIQSLKRKAKKRNRKYKTKKKLKRKNGFNFFFLNKNRNIKSKRNKKSNRNRSLKRKQSGGFTTTPVALTCSESSTQNNKALFEASFGYNHSQNSNNNTAPPTCSYIGQNGDQTTAYSCN